MARVITATAGLIAVVAGASLPAAVARAADAADTGFHGEGCLSFDRATSGGAMADLAGDGTGVEIAVRVMLPRSAVGFRLCASTADHEETSTVTQGSIFGIPLTGTRKTGHSIEWLAGGPEATFALERNRVVVYAMLGRASVERWEAGVAVNLSGPEPSSTVALGTIVGAAVIIEPGKGSPVSIEAGLEHRQAGACEFYDQPPIGPDGSGGYLRRVTRASVSTMNLRLGVVRRFW
jgi:hypothetical protein